MPDVTRILKSIEDGNPQAAVELLPMVYEELRKLAASKMVRENPGQTLQATALVHEAYMRLVDGEQSYRWDSRGHFFSAAGEAMRRILIDIARRKQSPKHGGERRRVDLDSVFPATTAPPDSLLAMDEALVKFAQIAPEQAKLVNLRYYAGCSLSDAADLLGISISTAKRRWAYVRAWFIEELTSQN